MKEYLNKTPLWDFYETSKGDYMNKSNDEKKLLILSYYNYMNVGINLLFVVWLFFINNKIFSSEVIVCVEFTIWRVSSFLIVCMGNVVWIFWFVCVVWIVWFNVWVWIFIFRTILWTICRMLPYLAIFENNSIVTFFVFSNIFKIFFTVASCGSWFLS